MTPEQRYLFDTVGYFSLKNALSSEELQRAQEAADRYINTPPDDLTRHPTTCQSDFILEI